MKTLFLPSLKPEQKNQKMATCGGCQSKRKLRFMVRMPNGKIFCEDCAGFLEVKIKR